MPLIGVAKEGADCLEAYTACNLAEYCNCRYQIADRLLHMKVIKKLPRDGQWPTICGETIQVIHLFIVIVE